MTYPECGSTIVEDIDSDDEGALCVCCDCGAEWWKYNEDDDVRAN